MPGTQGQTSGSPLKKFQILCLKQVNLRHKLGASESVPGPLGQTSWIPAESEELGAWTTTITFSAAGIQTFVCGIRGQGMHIRRHTLQTESLPFHTEDSPADLVCTTSPIKCQAEFQAGVSCSGAKPRNSELTR